MNEHMIQIIFGEWYHAARIPHHIDIRRPTFPSGGVGLEGALL